MFFDRNTGEKVAQLDKKSGFITNHFNDIIIKKGCCLVG